MYETNSGSPCTMKVPIINRSNNPLPAYATKQSAGLDLYANLENEVCLQPMERRLIPTGIFLALPEGYEAQIRPRSGLALKKGVTVLNTPGTIDSDFRGEIQVILVNLSSEEVRIQHGERIAQMVIASYQTVEWQAVEALDKTSRGEGGFGHTGTK